jgi:monoamine oxidase
LGGAGLAGVRFAHYLWNNRRNPLPVTIYEANDRIGGRAWTNRNYFAGGQWAEHGAEFVSSEHTSVRDLVNALGLGLEVVNGGTDPTGIQTFWIDGAYYSLQQANADLLNALPTMRAAFRAAPFPQLYNQHTAAGVQLDHLSVPEWLDQNVVGGSSGKFGQLMLTNVLSEFGGEPAVQSALNLIYTLAYNTMICPLAGTDEKYHITGGNDQMVWLMAAQLPQSPIITGTSLIALKNNGNQTYACTFQQGAHTFDVTADHVVLALPFTTLKQVNLSQAGLSPLERSLLPLTTTFWARMPSSRCNSTAVRGTAPAVTTGCATRTQPSSRRCGM